MTEIILAPYDRRYLAFKIRANIMQIIVFLIVTSLIVAGGFLFAFFWAVKDGQYEDDYTPSMRILLDDDMLPTDESNTNSKSQIKSQL